MSARHDFYAPVHKGLRLGACRLLIRLGSIDWDDAPAAAELLADLRAHLVIAAKHLDHEDAEIQVLLQDCAQALGGRLDTDHVHHVETFREIELLMVQLEQARGPARAVAGHALYLGFSRHLGEDLLHMAREEQEALPILHACYDDATLAAAEHRIRAEIPLDRLVDYFRLMLAAASPAERIALMADMRAGAPAVVFETVMDQAARSALTTTDFDRLSAGLLRAETLGLSERFSPQVAAY